MFKFLKKMKEKSTDIAHPICQLSLYGYKKYFDLFKNLFEKNKLPNCVLLTGQKGIGKSTFAYHFINSLLSKNILTQITSWRTVLTEKALTLFNILSRT